MPYDFFLSRYQQAFIDETAAFCKALKNDEPAPISGKDGLCCLVMALAADKSAAENRWVKFLEIIEEAKNETTIEKLRAIHPAWVPEKHDKSDGESSVSFTEQSLSERLLGVFSDA